MPFSLGLAGAKIQRKWFEQGKKKQILVFKGSQSLFASDLSRFVSEKKGKPIQSKSLFASDLSRFVSKKGKPIQSKSLFASDLSRFVSEKKESQSKANPYLLQICPDLFPRKKGSQSKQFLGKPKFVPDNGLSFPITRQKNKARRPNGRQAFSLKVVKVISPLTCGSTFPCLPR